MKVWIVLEYGYEGEVYVRGAFRSEEAAEAYKKVNDLVGYVEETEMKE